MRPNEIRAIRLKNDYESMKNIKGDIIDWRITQGSENLPEEFEIILNIRSIVSDTPTYINKHIVKLRIPSDYPMSAPEASMQSNPVVFHPNWYSNGNWCPGNYLSTEGLADFVLRLARTLQFDRDITNEGSAANTDAKIFYERYKDSDMFPTDKQTLPDPTVSRKKKTFNIEGEVSLNKSKKKFIIE